MAVQTICKRTVRRNYMQRPLVLKYVQELEGRLLALLWLALFM